MISTDANYLMLKSSEMRKWSNSDICSFVCASRRVGGLELRMSSAWVLFQKGFSGFDLYNAIIELDEQSVEKLLETYRLSKYFRIELNRIIGWARKLDKDCYEIERVDFSQRIGSTFSPKEKQSFIKLFEDSMKQWAEKIEEETSKQKELLKGYFKKVFLPDRYDGFRRNYEGWTGHFDTFRYPESKGNNLREAMSSNLLVSGRGDEILHNILLFIDLSTSGKTYTIFNLAQSTTDEIDRFFVIYLYPNTILFNALIQSLSECGAEVSVALFCLANHILLEIIIGSYSDLSGLDFLKIIRNGGDGIVVEIFQKLLRIIGNDSSFIKIIENENIEYTKWFESQKFKVVFAFDEANNLTSHAVDTVDLNNSEKGSLFHAVYKVIARFNNPLFIDTKFKILDSIPEEERKYTKKIIGEMNPWFSQDVKIVLKEKFNFTESQPLPYLDSLCYLMSGYPEYLTTFHRLVLNDLKSENDIGQSIKRCIGQIVITKEDSSRRKFAKIMNYSDFIQESIFSLIFEGKVTIPLDSVVNNEVGRAIIETGFAPVVQVDKQYIHFQIVDPISFSVYYRLLFKNYRRKIWNYLLRNINNKKKEIAFEYFMHLLILEESETHEELQECELFSLPKEYEKYTLKVNSFVRGSNIYGLWKIQTDGFMLDTLFKPYDDLGTDLIFHLSTQENESSLVSTAFSLVSNDNQPEKILNLFQRTDTQRIHHMRGETENLNYSNKNCIRWIVCPFMKPVGVKWLETHGYEDLVKPFESKCHLLWTTRDDIERCIARYNNKEYYSDMLSVWEYFKSNPFQQM